MITTQVFLNVSKSMARMENLALKGIMMYLDFPVINHLED
jgi:hypothetical protein